jgi:hypothetical protein
MPAFTFEKISPPARPGAPEVDVEPKQPPRGVIVRMLDRFVEASVKRAMPKDGAHWRFPIKPGQ